MKVSTEPYQEALTKRIAQTSTVIVFQCSDRMRLEPFIRFAAERFRFRDPENPLAQLEPKIYVYLIWRGLHRAVVESESIKYELVTSSAQSLIAPQTRHIRDLMQAVQFIDDLMTREKNVVFVIYGLNRRYDFLIDFVRCVIFTGEYYLNKHTVVIFTEDPLSVLDEDTLRYVVLIKIKPSTEDERLEMIKEIAEMYKIRLNRSDLNMLVEMTKGLTLHELESVLLESIYRHKTINIDVVSSYKMDIVRRSGLVDIEYPEHGFEAVGGYKIVKEFIRNNVIAVLRDPERAQRLGLRPPRGILFFGIQGTGKTVFARAIARELSIPFLRLRTERILSELYGRTERNLAKVLELAEEVAPAILFIDEIDRFGRRTTVDTDSGTTRRTFSILLEWLGDERRRTIVIGTTNMPEALDEAFIRVGRFDYIIPFLLPDEEARHEILKVHTQVKRRVPLAEDVDLREIARATRLFTGAELEELVLRACRYALVERSNVVTMRHFKLALSTFRIDQGTREKQVMHYMSLAERYCNDAQFLQQLKEELTKERELSRAELLRQELS